MRDSRVRPLAEGNSLGREQSLARLGAGTSLAQHPSQGKRVALVWAGEQRLTTISVRYERYLQGFRALGSEASVVSLAEAAAGFTEALRVAPSAAALRDGAFWRSLRLDAAIVITWLGLPTVVAALKQACPWVVSVADSDGVVGVRTHPQATLARSVLQHCHWLTRLRAAKFWLQRYLFQPGTLERDMVASARHSDLVAVCSAQARANLGLFFRQQQAADLAEKIAVIPYPVDECYLQGAVPVRRQRQLVAVGRWDDPQKDAPLLAATLARALAVDPTLRFQLVGPGGEKVFAPLCRRFAQVLYLGAQPPAAVADLLCDSRALLLSSRWESGPIVANEALCLGCTLVGPASLPSVASFCAQGRYGSVCRRRSAADLAAALLAEMCAWDQGRRDPTAIAAAWRDRFDPQTVCRQFLDPSDMVCT